MCHFSNLESLQLLECVGNFPIHQVYFSVVHPHLTSLDLHINNPGGSLQTLPKGLLKLAVQGDARQELNGPWFQRGWMTALPCLTELSFAVRGASDLFSEISQLESLTTLHLTLNEQDGRKAVEFVGHPRLQTLSITGIGGPFLVEMNDQAPELRSLEFRQGTTFRRSLGQWLSQLPKLAELKVCSDANALPALFLTSESLESVVLNRRALVHGPMPRLRNYKGRPPRTLAEWPRIESLDLLEKGREGMGLLSWQGRPEKKKKNKKKRNKKEEEEETTRVDDEWPSITSLTLRKRDLATRIAWHWPRLKRLVLNDVETSLVPSFFTTPSSLGLREVTLLDVSLKWFRELEPLQNLESLIVHDTFVKTMDGFALLLARLRHVEWQHDPTCHRLQFAPADVPDSVGYLESARFIPADPEFVECLLSRRRSCLRTLVVPIECAVSPEHFDACSTLWEDLHRYHIVPS